MKNLPDLLFGISLITAALAVVTQAAKWILPRTAALHWGIMGLTGLGFLVITCTLLSFAIYLKLMQK